MYNVNTRVQSNHTVIVGQSQETQLEVRVFDFYKEYNHTYILYSMYCALSLLAQTAPARLL